MIRSVFIVDEDLDCRVVLGDVLEGEGWRPVLFRDPREALPALASIPPALIVTELWRPGTPAAGPFQALLEATSHAALPVIVFSSWNRTAAGPRLAFPFVPKPEIKILLKSLRTLASLPDPAPPRRRRARRETFSEAA